MRFYEYFTDFFQDRNEVFYFIKLYIGGCLQDKYKGSSRSSFGTCERREGNFRQIPTKMEIALVLSVCLRYVSLLLFHNDLEQLED